MKKYGALIALGVAIIFGVLAVYLANKWMTSQQPEIQTVVREQVPTTKIVIASRDIPVGTMLNKEVLALAEWPKANVPQGAFYDPTELEGRVAVTQLSAGTPLRKAELAESGSGAGLVALIPQGSRAMSIRVDEVIGVAGFILPNTFVDVVHVDPDQKSNQSSIILEKVKVLAIAQETYTDEKGGKAKVVRTVTLQLKPEEATTLALKTRRGSIHLLLRNPLEDKEEKVAAESEPEIKKKPAPKPKPKPIPVLKSRISSPAPTPYTVEIIRGSEREDVRFKHIESEDVIK
ncbi:MAG: Flp pilus assembly protein CpaB [Desulfurivibrionaceae bacterium]|nr:Flp pilus assembly protein CpaB [Desulfobulbales bacterium]MDT8335288.1 Flp pilus assembly protein CpaB [Desulfurivibrionaceae bacterium]